MKKSAVIAIILSLVSYNCYSLNASEIKTNDLITSKKTEHKLNQDNDKNQYFHEKMKSNNEQRIDALIWSKKNKNNQRKPNDFSAKMLSATNGQGNRQLLNESQDKFLHGVEHEDSSTGISLSLPVR